MQPALEVLRAWRAHGQDAARSQLHGLPPPATRGPLLKELQLRLDGAEGPRLLVDGLWFCRPHGGITRVWEQVLDCWRLPGLLSPSAPLLIIDRDSHMAITSAFDSVEGAVVDPLDTAAVVCLDHDNGQLASSWGADAFLSSWISTCAPQICPALALVHDCIPERAQHLSPLLAEQRRRWLLQARGYLAVSAATAADLEAALGHSHGSVSWCHPSVQPLFLPSESHQDLEVRAVPPGAGLEPYVLLPATSAPGSYKNPELLARALCHPALEQVQLLMTGLAATTHAEALLRLFPALRARLHVRGCTDLELSSAYRHALATVVPSRVEGFGLPALEALASGGTVIVTDVNGLREAGGGAALRCDPERPEQLVGLLTLLLDAPSAQWIQPLLHRCRHRRMAALCPDLLGLALLAQARQVAASCRP